MVFCIRLPHGKFVNRIIELFHIVNTDIFTWIDKVFVTAVVVVAFSARYVNTEPIKSQ